MQRPTPINKERVMRDDDFIVSKTDTKGIIKYGNKIFIEFSGYTEQELLGANHNIIRHPDMPRCVFWLLWETISKGNEIFAYVKNMSKDGSYYWVLANVTPSYDSNRNIIGYYSVRRKPRKEAVSAVEPIYKLLLQEEAKYSNRKEGIQAGVALIQSLLSEQGVSYEEFVLSL